MKELVSDKLNQNKGSDYTIGIVIQKVYKIFILFNCYYSHYDYNQRIHC